jgi:hypothetical protein
MRGSALACSNMCLAEGEVFVEFGQACQPGVALWDLSRTPRTRFIAVATPASRPNSNDAATRLDGGVECIECCWRNDQAFERGACCLVRGAAVYLVFLVWLMGGQRVERRVRISAGHSSSLNASASAGVSRLGQVGVFGVRVRCCVRW